VPTLDHYLKLGSWFAGTPDDLVAHLKSFEERYPGMRHINLSPPLTTRRTRWSSSMVGELCRIFARASGAGCGEIGRVLGCGLRDAEWARLAPLIPEASPGGRPRKIDMRAAMKQSLFDAFFRQPGCDLSRLLPRWVVEHKTSGDRRCRDETAFVPAKQAIPVARDPVIGPVADTPRQQQEYSRPGPTGQAGKNEDHGVGFEICVAIDNGDVSLGAGDIDGETGRQGRSASTLDRDETEPCAGIALNHEPHPPATKYANPVEQDEPIGNVVEAPRHPSLAHPILHRHRVRRPTGS